MDTFKSGNPDRRSSSLIVNKEGEQLRTQMNLVLFSLLDA